MRWPWAEIWLRGVERGEVRGVEDVAWEGSLGEQDWAECWA